MRVWRACLLICCSLLLLTVALPNAAALPDATVVGITVSETRLRAGVEVPLEVSIRNAGSAPLPSAPVAVSVDGRPAGEWRSAPDLQPGETASWLLGWTAAPGRHLVTATIDPLNDIRELDERNNSAALNLVVEEERPFPWPAVALGVIGLTLGLAAGSLLRRAHDRRRASPQAPARGAGPPSGGDGAD